MTFSASMSSFLVGTERSRIIMFRTYESRTSIPVIRLWFGLLLLLRMPECLEDILEEVLKRQEDVSKEIFQSQSEVFEE